MGVLSLPQRWAFPAAGLAAGGSGSGRAPLGSAEVKGRSSCSDLPGPDPPSAPGTTGAAVPLLSLRPFSLGCPVAEPLPCQPIRRWLQPRVPDNVALEQARAACARCGKRASAAVQFSLEGKAELRGMQTARSVCWCQLRAGRSLNTPSIIKTQQAYPADAEHQQCGEQQIFELCNVTKTEAGVLPGIKNCLCCCSCCLGLSFSSLQ